MRVPFVDLERVHAPLEQELNRAFQRVLKSQRFILGPEVTHFERDVLSYVALEGHAVGTSSGTSALALALAALNIGPGHEVIVPAHTFVATASTVLARGATPVFVDVLPDTFNLDCSQVADAVSPRTRAVIPVDLFGQPADYSALSASLAAAGVPDCPVVEDAAQSIGARCDGVRAGALAPIACLSFFPAKNLGALGDAGMVLCQDDKLAQRLRALRVHGRTDTYYHEYLGDNARLDALQAALLAVKLTCLDDWVTARRQNAARYHELLAPVASAGHLTLPYPGRAGVEHSYNQYVIRVGDGRRDALRTRLAEAGIGTAVYYPRALPEQPCFAHLGVAQGSFPVARACCADSLALPVFPGLTDVEQDEVADRVSAFFA